MTFLTWDHKEQPDWDDVNFAIDRSVEKHGSARVFVINTQSDQYGIVVGPHGMTKDEAQAFYDSES